MYILINLSYQPKTYYQSHEGKRVQDTECISDARWFHSKNLADDIQKQLLIISTDKWIVDELDLRII